MNSRIEINLGGKLRGIRFNQISLEIFSKNIVPEAPLASSIYATFYAGLYGECVVKREDIDFTLEDVSGWVDDLYNENKREEIRKVCEMWEETNYYREWMKGFQEKIRALLEPEEAAEKMDGVKKKKKRTSNGSKSTSSHSVA